MRGTLAHAVGIAEDNDTLPVKEVLDRLTIHFQRQRNVALRRILPKPPEALRLCRSEESALNTETDSPANRRGCLESSKYENTDTRAHLATAIMRFGAKCEGCGGEPHPQGPPKSSGKAWGKRCDACGITGHYSKVCPKKGIHQGRTSEGRVGPTLVPEKP
ncbi:hypothetical protein GWK47_030683 [Chionoecetes opilio]|uniref:CCHC-type domain-containing protein n=1 Tax=Chionoecetes opilio TaxID=41210 RepID=A0A8J5D4M1_CHIOP|nr:hypothetical protein GWK47_030683 [Chionoecetes opilio]